MSLEQYKTQVLLLHSQQSTLDTLSAGFNDRFAVHCATSGTEALNTLGETPIHVIVSAQNLPGMSGLEALREARKRSPDTVGILLAGTDKQDGLEALVGDQEVFQIVRGAVSPEALIDLIETATQRVRLMTLSESANDQKANVDEPVAEHIVMETSENGSTIISDGTGTLPTLKQSRIDLAAGVGGREVDVLVLTQDEEFLGTIRDSARGLHNVYHSLTPAQAEEIVAKNNVGVLVTDAAMVGSRVEELTQRLRNNSPRVVAIVAGRRDDGELLMDLINRGHVYRFLLKPVSPGRARLAIEASVKHHMEAPEAAFKPKSQTASAKPAQKATPVAKAAAKPMPKPAAKPAPKPVAKPPTAVKPAPVVNRAPPPQAPTPIRKQPAVQQQATAQQKIEPTISTAGGPLVSDELDQAFDETSSFTETMTGIAATVGRSFSNATETMSGGTQGMLDSVGDMSSGGGSKTKLYAIGASALAVVGVIAWLFMSGGTDSAVTTTDQVSAETAAPTGEVQQATAGPADAVPNGAAPAPADQPALPTGTDTFTAELQRARAARDAGNLISPSGFSAVELFIEAAALSGNDPVVVAELEGVVGDALGLAENAILARNPAEAENALDMVRLADPNNTRLNFLLAQLNELQLRSHIDNARVAIRDGRYEDATALIAQARALPGDNLAEIELLTTELNGVRAQQEVGATISLANLRLEEGNLVSPANDNARFHFNSALVSDPDNQAAQQGLVTVASKLVLQARDAIDNNQLDTAETLLGEAAAIDPASSELATASNALTDARAAIVEAVRLAALEEQAAAERAAEEIRLAEQQQADADRLAEAEAEAEAAASAATGAAAELATTAKPDIVSPSGVTTSPLGARATKPESQEAQPDERVAETVAAAVTDDAGEQQQAAVAPLQQSEQTETAAAPAETELVSISKLTRTNYVGPEYPRTARRRGITGFADVTFTVTTDGRVNDLSVIRSEPGDTFAQAAMDAVENWRFEPVVENGVEVEKRSAVRLAFDLE